MATFLSLNILLLLCVLHPLSTAARSPQSPPPRHFSAVLAFGDSTLDSGNNNHLPTPTFVRSDHLPYGVDFPGRVSTGRFSNGRLITDYLVSTLGLKQFLPASSDPNLTTQDLITGVSFASAGSGLDDLTAIQAGVMTVGDQISGFEEYTDRLRRAVGRPAADRAVADALFIVGVGSNDLIMNYYVLPTRRTTYSTVEAYHSFLLGRMQSLLERLYSMGARRFAVAGLPPLGCVPLQMTLESASSLSAPPFRPRTCVDQQNVDAVAYNNRLQQLLQRMTASLPSSKVAYGDIYNSLMDMVRRASAYGFTETSLGCCGTGTLEMGLLCSTPLPTCSDPSKFMFWDSVHPSQAAYEAIAQQIMETVIPKLLVNN